MTNRRHQGWRGSAGGRLALALLATTFGVATHARAQGPDVRDIRPVVMLLVDTSGSMERMPSCVCPANTDCSECLPTCTNTVGTTNEKNRWSVVLEALTGSWPSFTCQQRDRRSFAPSFDDRYFLPHFAHPGTTGQLEDGVLDTYRDRVKFGLMTFDAIGTLSNRSPLVFQSVFEAPLFLADSVDELGSYSYGERKDFLFPFCGQAHMVDYGSRNESATMGRLVSVGSEGSSDYVTINRDIQEALLAVRPYGATPIAAMLDDFRYYLDNHADVAPPATAGGVTTGDPYRSCRQRYAVLITDGYPNADFRGPPYDCEDATLSCPDRPSSCCPYERPEAIAADLCRFDPSADECAGTLDGLFVVGFDIDDPDARARLDEIADQGGTGEALIATAGTLATRIGEAINRSAPGTTTRTVPTFSSMTSSGSSERGSQAQFSTGFVVESLGPWEGRLERMRFECNDAFQPVAQPLTDDDRFHVQLTRQSSRTLYTVVPRRTADVTEHLIGDVETLPTFGSSAGNGGGNGGRSGQGGRSCGGGGGGGGGGRGGSSGSDAAETGLSLRSFDNTIPRAYFGVSSDADRDAIVEWVHGTTRANKLGDIYHSSPVVVGPPTQDIPDESFNEFRQLDYVANRPTVLYVGSNDGVLHAFAARDTTITEGPHRGRAFQAGEEIWGFVPPMHFPRLNLARSTHQLLVDSTPVVKEIFMRRGPGETSALFYRTILVMGMRGGGPGYIALDVTDPLDPQFLWQFAHPDLGNTYGTPALGQILVDSQGGVEERAIALLPGGTGDDLSGPGCGYDASGPVGCPSQGVGRPPVTQGTTNARSRQRCWNTRGRQLFAIDPITGELAEHLDDRVFNAPLTGGISLFPGEVGQVSTRAFFTDADGVIWRLDISPTRVSDWSAAPLHDIFYDGEPFDGQPAYFPPVLSTDNENRVVLLQATGNVDVLDGVAANRVVSLTEQLNFRSDGSGLLDATNPVSAILNWEVRLAAGEQVTGPLELFQSHVYFATFSSSSGSVDACAFGSSRIWGLSYRETVAGAARGAFENPVGSGQFDQTIGPFDNQIIMGVAITQRPSCLELTEVSETDPYIPSRTTSRIGQTGGGTFDLVAQVSGERTAAGGASVSTLTIPLPTPLSYTAIEGWSGSL